MALTSVNLAARAASYREILGEQLAGKPTGKSFQILFSHVLWSVLFSTTDLFRGSRWERPCVWHWARTPSRLPLSYIDIMPQSKFFLLVYGYHRGLHPESLWQSVLSSPLLSPWQQETAAWLSCSHGCSVHSPSPARTSVSLLQARSPG